MRLIFLWTCGKRTEKHSTCIEWTFHFVMIENIHFVPIRKLKCTQTKGVESMGALFTQNLKIWTLKCWKRQQEKNDCKDLISLSKIIFSSVLFFCEICSQMKLRCSHNICCHFFWICILDRCVILHWQRQINRFGSASRSFVAAASILSIRTSPMSKRERCMISAN